MLSRTLNSADVHRKIVSGAPSGTYEVMGDVTTSAPILLATTEAHAPASADKMLARVLAQVPVALRHLQDSLGVAPSAQITTQLIAHSGHPLVVQKKRYRSIVLAGGSSMALGLLMVGLLDGLLLRRRARRAEVVELIPPEARDAKRDNPPDTRRWKRR